MEFIKKLKDKVSNIIYKARLFGSNLKERYNNLSIFKKILVLFLMSIIGFFLFLIFVGQVLTTILLDFLPLIAETKAWTVFCAITLVLLVIPVLLIIFVVKGFMHPLTPVVYAQTKTIREQQRLRQDNQRMLEEINRMNRNLEIANQQRQQYYNNQHQNNNQNRENPPMY